MLWAESAHGLPHVLRGQEAAVVHIHPRGEIRRIPGGFLQGVEGHALPRLPADRLEHPQAHDVLEIPEPVPIAPLIGEVAGQTLRGSDWLWQLGAQKAPRTAGEVHAVLLSGHG